MKLDSTPAMIAVETSSLLAREVAADKRLLEIATAEDSRQLRHSMEIRSERHSSLHSLQDPAVDSVSVQLVKIRPRRFDKLLGVETRNALQLLAAELPLTRLLASLHSAQDSVLDLSATESMDWRPVLRHWKSKHVTAVAS